MRNHILAAVLPFLLLAAAPAMADEWEKKFAVTGTPELHVDTNDGNVRLSTWDRNEIQARVRTVGWRIAPSEVRVTDRQEGNRVEVEVRIPHLRWGIGHRSVEIELSIPRAANLDVHTGDGNTTAEGVKGDIRLSTGDGRIEGGSLDGALAATTGDGNIHVSGRFDVLNLKTGDGNIEAEARAASKMTAAWTVHTGDGNVVLRLPQGFSADLDAHTGDGHISLDFPVTMSGRLSNSTIQGKINSGGPMLTVHTGDGSIRLERL